MATRYTVLDDEGSIAGFFVTNRPPATQGRPRLADFRGVSEGEWWPAGGFTHWEAAGENAWYRLAGAVGEAVEVPDL